MKQKRTITLELDQEGNPIAIIPLGKDGRYGKCKLYYEDLKLCLAYGCSLNWSIAGHGYPICSNSIDGRAISIARVILDAGPGEAVRFVDGDPANLTRENMYLVEDLKGKGRDRDRIRRSKNWDETTAIKKEVSYSTLNRLRREFNLDITTHETHKQTLEWIKHDDDNE